MSFILRDFATIRISVIDVEKSRDWYAKFFASEPIYDQKDFVSFRIGKICLDFCRADEKSPVSTGGSVGYWLIDNLDQGIERAKELGGKVYRGPLRVEEIQRTIVQIMDPFGNVFGLESES